MKSFRQIIKGLLIRGETADPSDNLEGSIFVNSTTSRLKMYLQAAIRTLVSEDQTQTLTNKTLSGNTATNLISGAGTLTLNTSGTATVPNATDTLVGKATTDILTNKTIDGDDNTVQDLALTSLKTNLTDASKFIVRDAAGIPVSNTKVVPAGVVVGDTDSQTLTNKTLTSPVINTPTGIVKSDVGLGNVDNTSDATKNAASVTLTNKTIDGDDNTVQDLPITALKTNITDASKFLVRDASGIPVSNTKAVPAGVVVGTTDTQTLSAKTFSDAPTLAEIATPSTPASGFGKVYFKSDGFLYQLNDDGTESKVGAGSGNINYITNSDLESNVTGYATYADAAATSPVDGTGGAATVTATRSTSSPLRGTASLLLTKDAANRQGEGISYDFTIASADKAKVLQCSFEYAIGSGTYADNDVSIWIYDVTNAVLIQPAPYLLKNHTTAAEKFGFEFQTSSSSTSYRLIFHVASTSASAYTLKFDNISVGPQAKLYGSPISDWVSYTPTITHNSGTMTNTTKTGYWRRVGDSIELSGSITFTGAAGTWNGITFSLPSGLSIDTAKLDSTTGKSLGIGYAYDAGVNLYPLLADYATTTNVHLYVEVTSGTYASVSDISQAVPMAFASGDTINWTAKVPILGWSSSAIMSSDASTRVVDFRVSSANSYAFGNGAYTLVDYNTAADYDSHGGWNLTTDKYTIQVPGDYLFGVCFDTATYAGVVNRPSKVAVYKNGTIDKDVAIDFAASASSYKKSANGVVLIKNLVAGDLIDMRAYSDDSGVLGSAIAAANYFWGQKISGPSQIMASELVEAHYSAAAGQSIAGTGTPAIIDYDTVVATSHGAVTTGASWKFTAPKAGTYSVKAAALLTTGGGWAAAEQAILYVYKNGAVVERISQNFSQAAHSTYVPVSGSTDIKLISGDYIDIRISQNSGGAITLEVGAVHNYVSIVSR